MKPEVAVILVVNLLPLHILALLADTEASSSATGSQANKRGPAADTRMNNLHPVGSRFEARRKRSADYRNPDDGRKFGQLRGRPLSAGGRDQLAEPNIADVGGSDGRWNNRDAPLIVGHHLADWHPVSEMSWMRRRSPGPVGAVEVRDSHLDDWSDTGMDWIKRRGDAGLRHRETAAGSSWTKRLVGKDDGEQRGAADNWEGGFADIDWMKRHHGTHLDD